MIKSTKSTLKFANNCKLSSLNQFLTEYTNVVQQFIDLLWNEKIILTLPDKSTTSKIYSWISKRAIQCAAKQASSIVRGTRRKQEKRLYKIKELNKQGFFKQARKLKTVYDSALINTPKLNNLNTFEAELDSRFVNIDMNNQTSFDGWIALTSLGNKLSIRLPFKKHRHFNKLLEQGAMKQGIRLSRTGITFMFDMPEPAQVLQGNTLGIDVGQKTTLSVSNGQAIEADKHGHTYQTICKRLSRKIKDSKSFERTQRHRSNYIRWCVNQVNLDGVKRINVEKIRYLRKNKKTKRELGHWNYAELFDVLESRFEGHGVHVLQVSPTYTSQRCSVCGWVRKGNRKSKRFKCGECGYTHDSDLNASVNLSLDLTPIGEKERLQRKNRTGFYWLAAGQEPIVPDALKTRISCFA